MARNIGEEWQDLIPEDRPNTSEYEIIYAMWQGLVLIGQNGCHFSAS